MTRNAEILRITPSLAMHVFYDKALKSWVGFYYSRVMLEQVGDAWYAHSRDEILIFRPEIGATTLANC